MDNFDRYINRKVNELQYAASDEQIAAMDALLSKKKRRFTWWVWLSSALFLLAIATLLMAIFNNQSDLDDIAKGPISQIVENQSETLPQIKSKENLNAHNSPSNQPLQTGDYSTMEKKNLRSTNSINAAEHESLEKATMSNVEINNKSIHSSKVAKAVENNSPDHKIRQYIHETNTETPAVFQSNFNGEQVKSRKEYSDKPIEVSFPYLLNQKSEFLIDFPETRTFVDPIDIKIIEKPSFGLHVGWSVFMPMEKSQDRSNDALSLGLNFQKSINPNWSILIKTGYQWRKGGLSYLKESSQKSYGFRLRTSNNQLFINQIHSLYASLGLEREIRKIKVGFDIIPKYVLGAKGDLHYQMNVGTENEEQFSYTDEWVKTTGFNSIPIDLGLSIGYEINTFLDIKVGGLYGLNPVFDVLEFEKEELYTYYRKSKRYALECAIYYSFN